MSSSCLIELINPNDMFFVGWDGVCVWGGGAGSIMIDHVYSCTYLERMFKRC